MPPTIPAKAFFVSLILALLPLPASTHDDIRDRALFLSETCCFDDIVAAAFPDQKQEYLDELIDKGLLDIAPWPHRENSVIAVMLTEPANVGPDTPAMFSLALLEEKAGKVVRRAWSRSPSSGMVWHTQLHLDLAKFTLNERETAFGVRLMTSYTSTGYSAQTEDLTLFRVDGSTIVPIFDAGMEGDLVEFSWEERQDGGEQEPGTSREYHAVLIVDSARTGGLHDFILKTTEMERDPEKSDKVISKTVRKERFKWNGKKYVKAGKTP